MTGSVLDASAMLAYLRDEPGAERVVDALEVGAFISVPNWAEVLTRVVDLGQDALAMEEQLTSGGVLGGALEVLALNQADAERMAALRAPTRKAGLSLGDRACLALAGRLELPAITADGVWAAALDVGVDVTLIR